MVASAYPPSHKIPQNKSGMCHFQDDKGEKSSYWDDTVSYECSTPSLCFGGGAFFRRGLGWGKISCLTQEGARVNAVSFKKAVISNTVRNLSRINAERVLKRSLLSSRWQLLLKITAAVAGYGTEGNYTLHYPLRFLHCQVRTLAGAAHAARSKTKTPEHCCPGAFL